MFMILIVNR